MALTQKQLEALVRNQYRPGESGNRGGATRTKPISDAMRVLLSGDKEAFMRLPRNLRLMVGRWYGHAWSSPHGMSLLLDRIEGGIPKASEEKVMPTLEFVLQPIKTRSLPAGPVSESPREGSSLPRANGSESRIESKNGNHHPEVVEVEAVPFVEDEDGEEEDP